MQLPASHMTKRKPSISNRALMPLPARFPLHHVLLAALILGFTLPAHAQRASPGARVEDPLVEVSRACPGVVVELRYATSRNITGKPIYPPGARALLRKSVAERLNRAQQIVQDRGFSLKVWDAY